MNQKELPAIPAPARPTACAVIIRLAAEELGRKIHIDPLAIAKRYRHPMDGYELARELENNDNWHVDRATMEELDEMQEMVDRRLIKTQKVWAEENSIQTPLAVGSRIKCKSRNEFGIIESVCTGDRHIACYYVKPEGSGNPESLRWIVKFENAIAAPLLAPAAEVMP